MIGRVNTGGGGSGGILTVTAPANVTVAVSKDGKAKTKNSGTTGVVVFKGLASGTWTVTITGDGKTAQKSVVITTDYSTAISFNTIPEFTYTGDYEIVNDSDEIITVSQGNWKIRFLTSGTLTFTNLNGAENGIDVFLVGGGGGSWYGTWGGDSANQFIPSAAAGGGYTTTKKNISVTVGTPYVISIGAGGLGGTGDINDSGKNGGNTTAFGSTANGGKTGTTKTKGGDGGSGGAGYGGGSGGVDGADGSGGKYDEFAGGKGQGTTTREFAESTGKLYSTGGSFNKSNEVSANTGDGGNHGSAQANGHTGASGIVIIRNARGAA